MHCLWEELDEIRRMLYETVSGKKFDGHRQISEMEDKVYAKIEKSEEMRPARHRQTAEILAE